MTDTSKLVITAIRTRLWTHVPLGGEGALSTRLTGLHTVQAPDNATYRYAVLTCMRGDSAGYSGFREDWHVEVQFYGRPRSAHWLVEADADVADQAMRTWEDRSNGIQLAGYRSRWTLPPEPTPGDRELVRVRCLYEVAVWPELFTQYVTP